MAPYTQLLEDPTGNLAISDIRQSFADGKTVAAKAGGIALGYSPSAWWIGVRIPPTSSQANNEQRIIELGYPPLDRVDYYAPGAETPIVSGDLKPFSERPIVHRNFAFYVPAPVGNGPDLLLLRVQSAGILSVPLTLWAPHEFADASRTSYAIMAVFFGALLALMIFNAMIGLVIADRTYLHYIFLLCGLSLGVAGYGGLGYQYVWSDSPAFAQVAFPLGYSLCAYGLAQFTRSFLGTNQVSRPLDQLLRAAAGFSVASALTFPFFYQLAGKMLTSATVVTCVLAVVSGVFSAKRKVAQARLFLLTWSFFLVFGAIFPLSNLGILPSNFMTTHGVQLGSVIAMLMLSFALANRIQDERRAKEAAQLEALAAKQASIEQLLESERKLEEHVASRTAELAAANERLSQSEQRQRDLAQHDALTGLANRTLFSDRLSHVIAVAQRDTTRFALLYLDLDKFKPVNDTYGHAIGDALLREVAARINGRVRESDTVARIGGDEFVVLLRRIDSTQDALDIGNSIRQSLNQVFLVEKYELAISSSIGVAIYPDHGRTEMELSHRADGAMYRAKQAGRNFTCLADSAD